MGKVEDMAGEILNIGDHVVIQSYSLEVAIVKKFSSSCLICDHIWVRNDGVKSVGRLQPYLPSHSSTSSNSMYPNRMLRIMKITKEQYDRYYENL